MSVKAILDKIADFDTAIESIEQLLVIHEYNHLKPTFNYLKEQRQIVCKELGVFKINIETKTEII